MRKSNRVVFALIIIALTPELSLPGAALASVNPSTAKCEKILTSKLGALALTLPLVLSPAPLAQDHVTPPEHYQSPYTTSYDGSDGLWMIGSGYGGYFYFADGRIQHTADAAELAALKAIESINRRIAYETSLLTDTRIDAWVGELRGINQYYADDPLPRHKNIVQAAQETLRKVTFLGLKQKSEQFKKELETRKPSPKAPSPRDSINIHSLSPTDFATPYDVQSQRKRALTPVVMRNEVRDEAPQEALVRFEIDTSDVEYELGLESDEELAKFKESLARVRSIPGVQSIRLDFMVVKGQKYFYENYADWFGKLNVNADMQDALTSMISYFRLDDGAPVNNLLRRWADPNSIEKMAYCQNSRVCVIYTKTEHVL